MKKEKGFTLIELLVVITVIGLLAGIVLINLRGARERAMDARIIAALGQIRAVAEIIFSRDRNDYTAICLNAGSLRIADTASGLDLLQQEIFDNQRTPPPAALECHAAGSNFCVSARLNDGTTWCVNSAGLSRRGAACGAPNGGC